MSNIHRVNYKVIQSGNMFELYSYSRGYLKGYNVPDRGSGVRLEDEFLEEEPLSPEEVLANKKKAINRATTRVRRLIQSNIEGHGKERSKFLTLTFAKHITDLDKAHDMFMKFIKRLNYNVMKSKRSVLKYLAVWELTKKGRIHYHVVLFNMPYVDVHDLRDIWGHGTIDIQAIDNIDNVGAYITKVSSYMSKTDERQLSDNYKNRRSYFCSKGLKKPLEITDPKFVFRAIFKILQSKIEAHFSWESFNEYLGTIIYSQYNIDGINLYEYLGIGEHGYDFSTPLSGVDLSGFVPLSHDIVMFIRG